MKNEIDNLFKELVAVGILATFFTTLTFNYNQAEKKVSIKKSNVVYGFRGVVKKSISFVPNLTKTQDFLNPNSVSYPEGYHNGTDYGCYFGDSISSLADGTLLNSPTFGRY